MFISQVLGAATGRYIDGYGGRKYNNSVRMQGLSMKSLLHHHSLIPLFVIMGVGMVGVVSYTIRAARKHTDINWTKQKEPDAPMEYYRARQYKLLNPAGTDYSIPSPTPNYKN